MLRILFCALVCAVAFGTAVLRSEAQTVKTVIGNLCSNIDNTKVYDPRNPFGRMGLLVKGKPIFFRIVVYGIPMHLTDYYRHAWPKTDPVGTQYLVRYKLVDGRNQALSISATGRRKSVQPCLEQ